MDKIIIIFAAISVTNCFYTYLTPQKPQCFYNHVFKDERLLVQVEVPIISLQHKIMLIVVNGNNTLLEWDIINNAKITVPRLNSKIGDDNSTDSQEYQSCLTVVVDQTVSLNQTDQQNPVREKKGYFVHVKFMTNFNHKLEATKERSSVELKNTNYIELSKVAAKLKQINSEQITLHQVNEVKEKLSQYYLQDLKGRVIVFSMLEILIVVLFTCMQLKMMKGYVNGLSVV